MWTRYTLKDVQAVAYYLGSLVLFFSLAMLIPVLVAVVFTEWEAAVRYLAGIGASLTIGCALRIVCPHPSRLTHQQALAVTGLAWLFLAVIASLPLFFSGHYGRYLDALFEGVSGLTTTGASLVLDIEHLSYADNMWRFIMHFLGGLGLIVVALSLGFMGQTTSGLYSTEGRSDHVLPNVVQTTRTISVIAVVVIAIATVVLSVMCLIAGMEPVRACLNALWVAISGFMTAGFTPTSLSIMYYHSFPIELTCMVLMILGIISFTLFVAVWNGDVEMFFKDIEVRTFVIWIIVMGTVFMAALSTTGMFTDVFEMLRRGVFMFFSAASTTGFQVVTDSQLATVVSSGALLILGLLMAVGGSSGSTAGGMKLMRMGLIAKSLATTIREAVSPDSAKVSTVFHHIGRHILTADIARSAMTVTSLFALTYVIGAIVGIAHGYDATSAIFDSISMASNGGLTCGIVSNGMPITLELVYIAEMWAGRLEFITLIALIVKIIVSLTPKNRGSIRND